MMIKLHLALLVMILTATLITASADLNSPSNGLYNALEVPLADVWTDKGGRGLNASGGYYKVGDEITIYFNVSKFMYVELYDILPDGTKVRLVDKSMVGPGVIYKVKITVINPGPRTFQLIGGYSRSVLDSCTVHVLTAGRPTGDIWTGRGGRGHGFPGGVYAPGEKILLYFKVNMTSTVEIKMKLPDGSEKVILEDQVDGNRKYYVYVEAPKKEGKIYFYLIHSDQVLDSCQVSVASVGLEQYPPIIEVTSIEVRDTIVTVRGKAYPGSSNTSIEDISWDWGDGIKESGDFPKKHEYRSPGAYVITITVKQSDGLRSNFTYTVTIPVKGEVLSPKPITTSREPELKTTTVTEVYTVPFTKEVEPPREEPPWIYFILGVGITFAVLGALEIVKRGRGSSKKALDQSNQSSDSSDSTT